jgi:hypothetical protein
MQCAIDRLRRSGRQTTCVPRPAGSRALIPEVYLFGGVGKNPHNEKNALHV